MTKDLWTREQLNMIKDHAAKYADKYVQNLQKDILIEKLIAKLDECIIDLKTIFSNSNLYTFNEVNEIINEYRKFISKAESDHGDLIGYEDSK